MHQLMGPMDTKSIATVAVALAAGLAIVWVQYRINLWFARKTTSFSLKGIFRGIGTIFPRYKTIGESGIEVGKVAAPTITYVLLGIVLSLNVLMAWVWVGEGLSTTQLAPRIAFTLLPSCALSIIISLLLQARFGRGGYLIHSKPKQLKSKVIGLTPDQVLTHAAEIVSGTNLKISRRTSNCLVFRENLKWFKLEPSFFYPVYLIPSESGTVLEVGIANLLQATPTTVFMLEKHEQFFNFLTFELSRFRN